MSKPALPFRHQNDGRQSHFSDKSGLNFLVLDPKTGELVPELTRTQQSFAEDCDINRMLEQFNRTGQIPNGGNANTPMYGDFTSVPDFQTAMDIVIRGNDMFDALDAKTRKRFGNDPLLYLEFINDPTNYEEGVKLGLFVPRVEETPPGDRKGISEGGGSPHLTKSPVKASKSHSEANES